MELENGPALSSQPQKQFFSANTVGYLVFLMSQIPISSSRKLAAGCSVAGISAVSRKSNIDQIDALLDRFTFTPRKTALRDTTK
jgi:hypothetical protein